MPQATQRVLFLDRDGTLNVDHGYVHRIYDWQFIEGAVEALHRFRDQGFALAIVTNQSGVGSGRYTTAEVEALHDWLAVQLDAAGVPVAAIVYCPHAASAECPCRKPKPGLGRQVERILDKPIDYKNSWTIGDKPSDVEFGRALGTKTVLLASRYWQPAEIDVIPTLFADSLFEAAEQIFYTDFK